MGKWRDQWHPVPWFPWFQDTLSPLGEAAWKGAKRVTLTDGGRWWFFVRRNPSKPKVVPAVKSMFERRYILKLKPIILGTYVKFSGGGGVHNQSEHKPVRCVRMTSVVGPYPFADRSVRVDWPFQRPDDTMEIEWSKNRRTLSLSTPVQYYLVFQTGNVMAFARNPGKSTVPACHNGNLSWKLPKLHHSMRPLFPRNLGY